MKRAIGLYMFLVLNTAIVSVFLCVCVWGCGSGVRYFTRGVDYDGHVANYVETEQIIVHKQCTTSFVQVKDGHLCV